MQPTDTSLLPDSVSTATVVPVIEEFVHVDKELVETGRVVVRKQVHVDTQTVDVTLRQEQVQIQRIAVNQYVDEAPVVRYEGDIMIVPVLREEVVVTKRLLLVEELHVHKQTLNIPSPQTIELRREEVHYERVGTPPPPANP